MAGLGVKALVITCNTATAAAIHLLRVTHPKLAIIGVEPALRPAAASSKSGHIGVLATPGTLASPKFRALLASISGGVHFKLQACDGLATAIEQQLDHEDATKLIATCDRYVRASGQFGHKNGEMDTLVLGCTHYPFASEHLAALLPAGVQLVAAGEAVARQTRRVVDPAHSAGTLDELAQQQRPTGKLSLLTTGQPLLLQAATQRWLGLRCDTAHLKL